MIRDIIYDKIVESEQNVFEIVDNLSIEVKEEVSIDLLFNNEIIFSTTKDPVESKHLINLLTELKDISNNFKTTFNKTSFTFKASIISTIILLLNIIISLWILTITQTSIQTPFPIFWMFMSVAGTIPVIYNLYQNFQDYKRLEKHQKEVIVTKIMYLLKNMTDETIIKEEKHIKNTFIRKKSKTEKIH